MVFSVAVVAVVADEQEKLGPLPETCAAPAVTRAGCATESVTSASVIKANRAKTLSFQGQDACTVTPLCFGKRAAGLARVA